MFDTDQSVEPLGNRVRRVHNYVYANDAIKQHPRVFDEIAKVLLAKLAWEKDECLGSFPERDDPRGSIERLYRSVAGKDAERLHLTTSVLEVVAGEFARVPLLGRDAKGAAFQAILAPQLRAEKGQFFTPDPAKRLLAEVLDCQSDETVLDPACGSGGLLVAAARGNLLGVEVDSTVARIGRLSLLLATGPAGSVVNVDALRPWSDLGRQVPAEFGQGQVDVVITNPPFGTKARVTDPQILAGFPALGVRRDGQVPELLFIERILQWLRPGGRGGIVLPLGVLANSSMADVRRYIRREADVIATVSLPSETFRPADNGVQASLLFVRKKGGPKPTPSHAFKAIVTRVGYDHRERPVYRTGPAGRTIDEDVSDVIEAWRHWNGIHKWF